MPSPDEVLETEFSEQFVQGMRDRMVVSFFKYGYVAETQGKVDYVSSLRKRLEKYEETGNTEWLMDVGNFAMIEFMFPRHPKAHFRGTDSRESPGRVDAMGQQTSENNRDIDPEEMRRRRESSERARLAFERDKAR